MKAEAVNTDDAKRGRIKDGAMQLALAYGYSRTTMDDIAKAAGMSRPALYLQFKNKTEIFRAIAQAMMEQSVNSARVCLSAAGRFDDRLFVAIDACMIALFAPLQASPHGAELLDMKSGLAADLTAEWRRRMAHLFGQAIDREAKATGIALDERGLSPAILADLLLDGLEGAKMRTTDAAEQRRVARGLVTVVSRAIAA